MYELQSLNLLHKIISTEEPRALASHISSNSELRFRSTRLYAALARTRVKTETDMRRFLYIQRYNALPLDLRDMSICVWFDMMFEPQTAPTQIDKAKIVLSLLETRRFKGRASSSVDDDKKYFTKVV